MDDKEKSLSDSMFNFDFLTEEGSSDSSAANDSSGDDHRDSQAPSEGSQDLPPNADSAQTSPRDSGGKTKSNAPHEPIIPTDQKIAFDSEMERIGTKYFTIAVMRDLTIVPAHFDSQSSTLRVFCQHQFDEQLRLKLEALLICQGSMNLALQSETTEIISALISRIEMNSRVDDSNHTVAETSPPAPDNTSYNQDESTTSQTNSATQERKATAATMTGKKATMSQCVLFVTPAGSLSPHMVFAICAEKIEPIVVRNCQSAIKEISDKNISFALIHSSLMGESSDLRRTLQEKNKQTPIRYYDSEAGLLTGAVYDCSVIELFETNLRFAAYLSDSPDNALRGHGATVAELCQRLADSYSLPSRLRLSLITAAHWHDIAIRDLKAPEAYSHGDIIALSASRLESLDSPDEVIDLLKIMAQPKRESRELGSEITLGGCILAVADYYSHNWPVPAYVSREQFTEMQNDLRQYSQSLTKPEIVDSLIDIIESEIKESAPASGAYVVQILDLTCGMQAPLLSGLQKALKESSFSCVMSHSVAECSENWANSETQALITLHSGNVQEITDSLFALALKGVNFESAPSILLTSDAVVEKVTWSIKHGIEDVFPFSINPDVLIAKLCRSQKRLQELSEARISALHDLGTHGSLEDMNLIKLLEAARDSSKPLRISVTARGSQLIAFIDNNRVHSATCAELIGIEAISQSIEWKQGIWSIDPIDKKDLPELNLGMTIDCVLLEACVQRDISAHSSGAHHTG